MFSKVGHMGSSSQNKVALEGNIGLHIYREIQSNVFQVPAKQNESGTKYEA
jgi:hypothetical protein